MDPAFAKDPSLMKLIARDTFRQNAIEPFRIPTQLPDRALALNEATQAHGTVGDLEVPADIAREKGKQQGAVKSHQSARDIVAQDQQSKGTRNGSLEEKSGLVVLDMASKQAERLATDLVFGNKEALVEFLVEEIRKHVLGHKQKS